MSGPQARLLPDGRRLHLNHGPIDLIIEAMGESRDVRRAYARAKALFQTLLGDIAAELAVLRTPISRLTRGAARGPVAHRMESAARAFHDIDRDIFVTPMAAVAGAVADHVSADLWANCGLTRLYVNDGGDIAFALRPGEALTCALPGGRVELHHDLPVRGIATSGRDGRSLSLGIADAVTVLARDAAQADVAATLIANAVDLPDHAEIARTPARDLDPDSDLGSRPVTMNVGALTDSDVATALAAGAHRAESYRRAGLIHAAALSLRGRVRLLQPAGGKPAALTGQAA